MALDLGMGAGTGGETPQGQSVEGHGGTIDTGATPPQGAPAGRPEYVPEQFWRAMADDPTKGEVNLEAWGKAWGDTKGHSTRVEQELAELRKSANLPSAPKDPADYLTGYDLAAVREAAPKVIPEDEALRTEGAKEWMDLAAKWQLSVEQARGFFGDYMATLNGHLPDPVDPKAEMEERIKALGSEGAVMQEKVQKALDTMHVERAFTEEQQILLRDVVRAPGGLGFLYRALETRGSIAPPTLEARTGDRMTAFEIRAAMQTPRYRQDDEYRKRIMDAHAAHEAQAQRDQPATHRTLSLG